MTVDVVSRRRTYCVGKLSSDLFGILKCHLAVYLFAFDIKI